MLCARWRICYFLYIYIGFDYFYSIVWAVTHCDVWLSVAVLDVIPERVLEQCGINAGEGENGLVGNVYKRKDVSEN